VEIPVICLDGYLRNGFFVTQAYGQPVAGSLLAMVTNIDTLVTANLDAMVSSRASQESVDELQTSVNGLNLSNLDAPVSSRADGSAYTNDRAANLDNLDAQVSSRATSADVTNAANAINSHTDSAIASLSTGGLTDAQFQTLKCNSGIKQRVDLSNCVLSFMNPENADLVLANLTGATFTGCTGTPFGTPAFGTLPTCS
jgi:hypothetical protein